MVETGKNMKKKKSKTTTTTTKMLLVHNTKFSDDVAELKLRIYIKNLVVQVIIWQ